MVKSHSLSPAGNLGVHPFLFLPLPSLCPPSHVVELLSASRLMIANNPIRKRHVRGVVQSGAGNLERKDQSERVTLETAQYRGGLARGIAEGPIREAERNTPSNGESAQWGVAPVWGPLLQGSSQNKRGTTSSLFHLLSPRLHRSRLPNF